MRPLGAEREVCHRQFRQVDTRKEGGPLLPKVSAGLGVTLSL